MGISESVDNLRKLIHQVIKDGEIPSEDYDSIIDMVKSDGYIDD